MHGVSWEHSLALIAMLASISIESSSDSTDLETDLDNSQHAEPSEENQQESLAKPERRLMAPPPQRRRRGWSFKWPWPFGRRKRPGGSQ